MWYRRMLALWALLACCTLAQGGVVRLDLQPAALVQGRAVLLGDVAGIDGVDARQREALAVLRVGTAPLAGYAEELNRAAIEAALRSSTAGFAWQPVWQGAERVLVRRSSRIVAGAELAGTARRHLESLFGRQYEELELTPHGAIADVQVPEGGLVLRARDVAGTLRQRTTVWVDVLLDGAVYRSVTVPFDVRGWRRVPVARRDLPAEGLAQAADFTVARHDVLALAGPAAALPNEGSRLRLREPVAAGQVLLGRHVVAAGAIRRGDRVTLVLATAGIRIESAAVAQEDGTAGGMLRVLPAGGGEAVSARAVGPGLVAIGEY